LIRKPVNGKYSEGYIVPATNDQDKKNIAAEKKVLNDPYDVLTSSCGTAVQAGLSAEGKKDGSPSFIDTIVARIVGSTTALENEKSPAKIYQRIKEQNKGKVVTPGN
jgi:hypothetical protein